MTLKVEDIFEILEELDAKKSGKNLLKEDDSSLVNTSSKMIKGKTQTITLPKLTVSEDWGKSGTPDRAVLQFIVDRASKGSTGRGALRKLANLNNYLDVVSSRMSTNFSISKLMASMIIIETMMKMFNSFSISSSGFLNEAFMSVFYGKDAVQVQPQDAYGIEDIVVKKPQEYISLKTLEKTRTRLVGSLKLLQKTLDDDTHGNKVYYHLFIKDSKEGKIKNVRMYEIAIQRNFIPVFYEDSVDSKKAFMGLVYVTKRPAPTPAPTKTVVPAQANPQVVKEDEEDDKENPTDDKVDDTEPSKTDITKPSAAQSTTTPPKKSRSKKKPVQPAAPIKMGPDPNEIDYKQCVLKNVQARYTSSLKESSEFDVPESVWIRFISYGIPKEGLFLDLSEDKYVKILARAADLLDAQLSAIFYNLDAFSKSITQFFTDDDTNAGLKAYRHAQELESRTSRLVKKDETGETGE